MKTLSCPQCGAPVTFRARFCAYCRGMLTFGAAPELGKGNAVVLHDLTSGITLPGCGTAATPKAGLGLEFTFDKAWTWRERVGPPMRDSVASMTAICYDAAGSFGIGARTHALGKMLAGYRVIVRPAYRDYSIKRVAGYEKGSYAEEIQPPRASAALQPIGKPNTVEVRCADSLFTIIINGTIAQSFEDAHFSFGQHAWVVASDGPSRVVVTSYETYELA